MLRGDLRQTGSRERVLRECPEGPVPAGRDRSLWAKIAQFGLMHRLIVEGPKWILLHERAFRAIFPLSFPHFSLSHISRKRRRRRGRRRRGRACLRELGASTLSSPLEAWSLTWSFVEDQTPILEGFELGLEHPRGWIGRALTPIWRSRELPSHLGARRLVDTFVGANEERKSCGRSDFMKSGRNGPYEEHDVNYEEEPEAVDEFDSDFDEDEPDPDDEAENEAEERLKPVKKRLIFPGKSMPKKKGKKKRCYTCCFASYHEANKAEKGGEEKRMTQEEMLLEAAETEIMNLRNLERVLAREEEVKKKAIIHKEVYNGPQIRFTSKNGKNYSHYFYSYHPPLQLVFPFSLNITFSLCLGRYADPEKSFCVVTGLPAKYRDPKTGLPYATMEAFKIIRERFLKEESEKKKPKKMDMGDLFDSISGEGFSNKRQRSMAGTTNGRNILVRKAGSMQGIKTRQSRLEITSYGVYGCNLLHNIEVTSSTIRTIAPPKMSTLESGATVNNPDYTSWVRTDRLVKSWIVGTLSEEVLGHAVGLQTAAEVWTALTNHFKQSSIACEFDLLAQLQHIMKGNNPLPTYVRNLNSICDQLHAIGKPVSDSTKVFSYELQIKRHSSPAPDVSMAFVSQWDAEAIGTEVEVEAITSTLKARVFLRRPKVADQRAINLLRRLGLILQP
uniref:Vps72/YL1 C-terminal domain-containing protein n=1 Tax=Ananas comosus var. bracteatus TaxID=296719 RepID=A0A6V7Q6J6_ANACO|nr:unnamed protein product [Ananas comosus var. bracteatus]